MNPRATRAQVSCSDLVAGRNRDARGASPKREREFEELKHRFEKSGRYGKRATEVAARIVNKQRAQYGETKGEKREEKEGRSPDRNLRIDGHRHLTIPQLRSRLHSLSRAELRKVKQYEEKHKDRKGAMQAIEVELENK